MNGTATGPVRSGPSMIEARGLSKFYGPFVAIKDISFSIPQGEIVAFLGPNGAGKTTTMKILTGFLAPSEGDAAIAGLDVRAERIAASRKLGYLPENGPLYPDMTPRELLEFFGEARGLEGSALRSRIEAVSAQCDLREVLSRPIGKLSKGYRQRVGLAQALLHDPEVLIMDEPTAGLDPNQIRDFRKHIRELGRTKTLLISTHILQEVEAVADRLLLVHEGRLVFDGRPGDLAENGSLEEPFHRLTGHAGGNGRPSASPPPPPVKEDPGATQMIRPQAESAGGSGQPARAATDREPSGVPVVDDLGTRRRRKPYVPPPRSAQQGKTDGAGQEDEDTGATRIIRPQADAAAGSDDEREDA